LDEIGSVVYEEMSFKAKVYGRTTDGRRTKSDHKSSPCHFVTGELKIKHKKTRNHPKRNKKEKEKKNEISVHLLYVDKLQTVT
jgi:hypothetical protein